MKKTFLLCLILFLPRAVPAGEQPSLPEHRLSVSFDLDRSLVRGTVQVPVTKGRTVSLQTGRLTVEQVSLNGRTASAPVKDGVLRIDAAEDGIVEVRYEGMFKGGEAVGDRNFGVVTSTIERRGISLTGLWYPQPEGLSRWSLTALVPAGFEAVSEAERIVRAERDGGTEFTFHFPHPVDGLSFVATDRYEVTRDRHGTVELAAYFFKEDRELAKTYVQHAKKYLELYEKLLTPYPFKRFAIVENFLSTGYSMATFTLLGQDVVRLPFIVETSLGHEVLHQWFGNSVYADLSRGNWTEGLTAYLADHWYEEQKGKGWEHRKQLLVNYGAYVNGANEFPLSEFRSRTDPASRAIGYGKAAMVFHLLRISAGDEAFFGALRDLIARHRFSVASWLDLEEAFSNRTGRDLSSFFRQWVTGKGLPGIGVESASLKRRAGQFEMKITVTRKDIGLPLDIPVAVLYLQGGEKRMSAKLDGDKQEITLLVDEEPAYVVLDGNYDLPRELTDDERPPVIARLLGDEQPLIAVQESDLPAYQAVIAGLAKEAAPGADKDKEKGGSRLTDAALKASTVAIMGADNPLAGRLFGSLPRPDAGFGVDVRVNPWNAKKVVAVFHARSADEAAAAFPRLAHYGKYSTLAFAKGRNTDKRITAGERGIVVGFREEPAVIDLSLLKKLSAVTAAAADKKVVYLGEYHDQFSHHNVQLQIVQELHRRDPRISIGMEMFQRPFQGTLDDYIAGAIDEREFLARSEYYKRWGFDYGLYKPILDFARRERVPVVALNLRKEIVEKVSKGGMDSLTDEERKELPAGTDFSDEDYRQRIRRAFEQHKERGDREFDHFLQAQVLWDETMAESIDEHLRKHPDRRMAVIAGGGHLAHGGGIPKRAFRRNGLPYLVVLNDGDVESGIADFIIFPQSLEGAAGARLMATFREEQGRPVINDFVTGSPARAAGLRADDAIVALDGAPVSSVHDIKLALFYKNKGDTMKVKVIRKRFLFGVKEMEFEVKL